MIIAPNHEKNGDYYKNPSWIISQMNFDYKENGGKNFFLANPKHQYRVSKYLEHDCNAQS